jgi:hypothetical protein
MAATVLVREKNGAGETATDKTSGTVRFKNADNATVDLVNPLIVPTANTEYSFEKWLRMHIGGTGPSSQITDLEFYMDGASGWAAGIKLWALAVAAYAQPEVPDETDDPPELDAGGTPTAGTNAFSYTSASPLSLGAGPYSATDTDMGSYLCMCMEVEIASGPGLLAAETATFEYDEI